ncbi:hypothetical protein AB0H73_03500 [Streptomyces olivoreticuli]|uniref:hypothetical protein n=1 Tax=Streptomyces olivoreticuli TaxID=68246 RepID=UPI000E22EF95|nr:hypothetical protein [Streptomyces olivoreticuli]
MSTEAPKPAEAAQPAEQNTPSEQAILAGLGAPIEHTEGAPIPGTEHSGPIHPTHTTGAQ